MVTEQSKEQWPVPAAPALAQMPEDRSAWTRPQVECVHDGVFRLPLPMPGDALKAVNIYAVEHANGFALIDGGWARPEARIQLDKSLAEIGTKASHITQILVTHAHRDHYTLAVMLRREFGIPIALGSGERKSIAVLASDDPHASFQSQIDLLEGAGADELAAAARKSATYVNSTQDGWENPDQWLNAGPVAVGERILSAVPTPGHTSGHLVFADLDRRLLFSGDHVLPHITPSIGLETVATPLPLADFLDSLALVRSMPDLQLLPAHGPVTNSSHQRVDELIDHHDERLAEILAVTASPSQSALSIASQIGWTRHRRDFRELDEFNKVLAIGETIAHLNLLIVRGTVKSRQDGRVVRYSATEQ